MRTNVNILLLLLAALLLGTPAPAQKKQATVEELRSQRAKTMKDLERTNKMLNETKQNEKATLGKLNLLNESIRERTLVINSLHSEIRGLDQEMVQLADKRDSLQSNLELLQKDYAELVRKSHYAQAQASPLLFILSASDFQQMIRRVRYMHDVQQYRKLQVEHIRNTQNEIDIQNELLRENKLNKEDAMRVQQRQQDNLNRDKKKQNAMLSELKKKEKDLLAQQKKQQKKADDLNQKIEQMIAEAVQKQSGAKMTKEQTLLAGGFEKNKGRLPWPVEKGFISGHYGVQQHPTLDKVTVNNKGVYIRTNAGEQARAVFDGEVTSCFVMSGTTAVIIQHGNYRTVYSGLATVSVKKGDKVKAKQKIGTIYNDPDQDNSTVLFFQVWRDKEILNPELWLSK